MHHESFKGKIMQATFLWWLLVAIDRKVSITNCWSWINHWWKTFLYRLLNKGRIYFQKIKQDLATVHFDANRHYIEKYIYPQIKLMQLLRIVSMSSPFFLQVDKSQVSVFLVGLTLQNRNIAWIYIRQLITIIELVCMIRPMANKL